jgi:tryptophanyl-tRNA synthetase
MNPMVPGLQGGKMSASDPGMRYTVYEDLDIHACFAPT